MMELLEPWTCSSIPCYYVQVKIIARHKKIIIQLFVKCYRYKVMVFYLVEIKDERQNGCTMQ
jgi:hypothetical protein